MYAHSYRSTYLMEIAAAYRTRFIRALCTNLMTMSLVNQRPYYLLHPLDPASETQPVPIVWLRFLLLVEFP